MPAAKAGAGAAAPDPTVNTSEPGPPEMTPEMRAAAAANLHDQAQADYEASMASAAQTREQGQALIDAADDMEDQAETERAAARKHAAAVEHGEA